MGKKNYWVCGLLRQKVPKVRQHSNVINKSVYLALGINMDGQKELLGMWIAQTEGA
ncbi:transposase, partial [Enterobacter sp. IF2SW-P2]|uniref:transposase n=1 Tax=Enterobacter sp. IF2SW-P2 TaxID=1841144 RepID=UPI001C403664